MNNLLSKFAIGVAAAVLLAGCVEDTRKPVRAWLSVLAAIKPPGNASHILMEPRHNRYG